MPNAAHAHVTHATASRVVVDMTTWGNDRAAIEAIALMIEKSILPRRELLPVTLVLTNEQHRWLLRGTSCLPLTPDERTDDLDVRRVESASEGGTATREAAGSAGLVVSAWRFDPIERWAALDAAGRSVELEPVDALDRFAEHGSLPGLHPVHLDLTQLGVEPATGASLPTRSGPERRRLIVALSSAEASQQLARPPAVRLAWSRELGVPAAATEREQIESEIQRVLVALPVPLRQSKDPVEERDAIITRARIRSIDPCAFRIGDEIHIVAPADAMPRDLVTNPRVRLHEVANPVLALDRMRTAIAQRTLDDRLADPFFEDLVPARGDADSLPFAYARATLFWNDALPPPAASKQVDPCRALEQLVREAPPSAEALLPLQGRYCSKGALRARSDREDLWMLCALPAKHPLRISRRDEVVEWKHDGYRSEITPPKPSLEPERWADAVERLPAEMQRQREASTYYRLDSWNFAHIDREIVSAGKAPFESTWAELDAFLAMLWFALRGLSKAEAITLTDGATLVHIGVGIFAQIRARAHGSSAAPAAAAFYAYKHGDGYRVFTHVTSAGTFGSRHELGHQLPLKLYLTGRGVALEVEFRFAPWRAGGGIDARLHAAAEAAVSDTEEEARQADDD